MLIDCFPDPELSRLDAENRSLRSLLADERARNIELVGRLCAATANERMAEATLNAARGRVDIAEEDARSWRRVAHEERAARDELQRKLDERADEIPSTERV